MGQQPETRSVSLAGEQSHAPRQALAEAASAREMHEIQSAMTIAKKFPRDLIAVRERIKEACTRVKLAEGALYQYSRGGTLISGPSIRLAEVLAQCFDNIDFGIRELEQRDGYSVVEAYCWDIERNVKQRKTFQVKHHRDTRNGGYALTDSRDIYELVANNGARRLRACILGVIPGDIQDEAVEACNATLKTEVEITDDTIKKMLDKFSEIGVTRQQIEAKIQCRIDSIRPGQFVRLRGIYSSINDGMSDPGDWFDPPKGTSAEDLTDAKPAGPVASTKEPPKPMDEPPPEEDDEAANAFLGGDS